MGGKNSGVCHNCQRKGHLFAEYPIKHRYPECNNDFQKCFEVERDTQNEGNFFKCCSHKCGFWEWCDIGESSGESSDISRTEIDNISCKFEYEVRLKDKEEINISLTVTIRKRK